MRGRRLRGGGEGATVNSADVIEVFQARTGEWLSARGAESDIVLSTRVRLARNVADVPFLTRATDSQKQQLEQTLRERLFEAGVAECVPSGELYYLGMADTAPVDRQCLVERHLISRELAAASCPCGVAVDRDESVSIMVNEEDHLRIQVLRSGFEPDAAWELAEQIDGRIEKVVNYAFSSRYGYLTACPTNCGTGLRVSVMLHLPALVMTKQIERVFEAVSKIHLAVRGFYGEGTQASGDLYQISNQVTLGRSERQILQQLRDVVPQIVEYERAVRRALLDGNRIKVEDRVWRAFGMLRCARTVTSEETMDLLSSVRMGVNLGLIDRLPIETVNRLFIRSQPGHLQYSVGRRLETHERDVVRADLIRDVLGALD